MISVLEERARTAIAALGEMVGVTGDDDTSETRHAASWPVKAAVINCTVAVRGRHTTE